MAKRPVRERIHPKVDQQYIDSGTWKCSEAPINPDVPLQVAEHCGAHYWIRINDESGEFYCKYCYGVRKLI